MKYRNANTGTKGLYIFFGTHVRDIIVDRIILNTLNRVGSQPSTSYNLLYPFSTTTWTSAAQCDKETDLIIRIYNSISQTVISHIKPLNIFRFMDIATKKFFVSKTTNII